LSTIGEQRANNYALAPMTKGRFVEVVTGGQNIPPAYFSYDTSLNSKVRPIFDGAEPVALSLAEALAHRDAGAVVIDTRDPNDFAAGHLKGSVNVGLAGRYAEFVGGVIEPERPIVLVGDDGTAPEAKIRLARIGFDSVVGYLEHPLVAFEANPDELGRSSRLNVSGLEWVMGERDDLQLIDIRQPGETAAGVIEGALLIPLTRLNEQLDVLDASKPTVIYCAVGFRSSIAASRMKAAGFDDVSDLLGGYNAWTAARTEVLV
jgi:rhodanese-related sulfurtransferase